MSDNEAARSSGGEEERFVHQRSRHAAASAPSLAQGKQVSSVVLRQSPQLTQREKLPKQDKPGQSKIDTFMVGGTPFSRGGRVQRTPPSPVKELHQEKKLKMQEPTGQNTTEDLLKQIIKKMAENGEELKEMRKLMEEEREERRAMEGEMKVWKNRVMKLEERIERMENRERKRNIVVKGIPEGRGERREVTEDKVKRMIDSQMEIKDIRADMIIRIGKEAEGRNRPILVKCADEMEKKRIIAGRTKLKGSKIFLEEDLSYEVRQKRKKLWHLAKKNEVDNKEIRWRDDKILIRGRRYELGIIEGEECLLEVNNEDQKNY